MDGNECYEGNLTLIGLNLIGGVLSLRASRDLFLTTLEWIAQDTQYKSFAYSLGKAYTEIETERHTINSLKICSVFIICYYIHSNKSFPPIKYAI